MINCSSIKTLFLTRYIPYPPMGGSALRNWQNINAMKKYGPVGIFSVSSNEIQSTELPGIELWEHYTLKGEISLWEKLERKFWPLRRLAHPNIDAIYEKKAAKKLEKILKKFNPNLIIVEESWLYRYLSIVKSYSCPIIGDNHNIEADLFEQTYGSLKLKLPRLKAIERDFIRQANQVWVCSQEEIKLLEKLYGKQSEVYSIPNSINLSDYEQVYLNQTDLPNDLEPRNHDILFLGQYNYPPNRIAAQILIEDIYPQLKQIYPDCRLLLVGRNPNPFMLKYSQQNPDIIVTGSVPDVRPYLAAASVMVVPLQQGGGTRLKVLEAFASGCPVISTKKGVEGLTVEDNKHVLIRENAQEMIQGVCQLWSDLSLTKSLSENAYELVKSNYSWEAAASYIEKGLENFII